MGISWWNLMEKSPSQRHPQTPNSPVHPGETLGVSRSWDFLLPTQTSRAFVHPPATLWALKAISPSLKDKQPLETSGNGVRAWW